MQGQVMDWEQMADEEMQRIARLERDSSQKRWSAYPRPNPFTNAYGYGSTLYKLKGDMDNHELTPITRQQAAKAFHKILHDIKNTKLMAFRERLIRASRSGDEAGINRITKQIRAHNCEDQETGLYD